jgi:hypothetical protein
MFMEKSLERSIIFYECGKMVFAGVTGAMKRKLDSASALIQTQYSSMEIAPVQLQRGRDFLAIFGFNPALDITIDQYSPAENSIVGYALDRERLVERMEGIAKLIGFIPNLSQSKKVAQTWRQELEIEKVNYTMCETLADVVKEPLEKTFGLVRYGNFLNQYMGKDLEAAHRLTLEKFGFPLS